MLYKKYYNIICSPTGGTKKVVEAISSVCPLEKETINLMHCTENFHSYAFHEDEICYIGVPSFGGRVPGFAIERLRMMKANHTPAIIITAFGNRDYDDTLLELKDCVEACGFLVVGAIAGVSEHTIMHQFATGRPNTNDVEQLRMFGKQVYEKIEKGDLSDIQVKGNRPYKEYHGVPLKPITTDACISCGVCATYCPVGAIPLDNAKTTDSDICVSCMGCISICPQHARFINPDMVNATALRLHEELCEPKINTCIL